MGMEVPNSSHNTSSELTEQHVDSFLEAARYDDLDDVVSLASMGVPLDSKDSQGRTGPEGVFGGHDDDDDNDCDGNQNGHTGWMDELLTLLPSCFNAALHMAAANGHLDIVDYLISRGVDVNSLNEEKNTPLHWACLNGHVEVVKKLILSGGNVGVLNSYERTPMDEAVSRGKLQVMDAINEAVTQLELTGASVSA